jgi:hypothetical protein
MEVGLPTEGKITAMYKFGEDRLLLVKERAAYEFTFADRIDPERTNESIPNVQQRILSAGSDNELVQSILLTSDRLFDPTYLSDLDCPELRSRALNAVKELLAMQRIADRLSLEQSSLIRELEGQKLVNGFIVPSLSDLEQELKNFLQRADHFTRELFKIIRIFEPGFGNLDGLLRRAKGEKPPNDGFVEFLLRATPFLKFVREARNAVEHPTPQKRVSVMDFELDKAGHLIPPTVEVVHPQYREPRVDLAIFLPELMRSLASVYGEFVANLCSRRGKLGGFDVAIAILPDEKRQYPATKYTYAVLLNGEWQPIG